MQRSAFGLPITWFKRTALLVIALAVLISSASNVLAQEAEDSDSDAEVTTQSIGSAIHSYQADIPLQRGVIVRLHSDDSNKVIPVTEKDMVDTFGVVVSPTEVPLSLGASEGAGNLTYVATSGTYNMLVNDQEGQIEKNDYVTVSAVSGIAMKATDQQPTVIGKALTNFDGKSNVTSEVTLKDSTGEPYKTVKIGLIPVAIAISSNPLKTSTRADLPEWLVRTGLVDKDIQPFRIYISIGILAIAVVAAITVLYAGIRHSVISIGRNPLSKGSIARSLLSIFLSAFIILIIGSFTVYLLLKL